MKTTCARAVAWKITATMSCGQALAGLAGFRLNPKLEELAAPRRIVAVGFTPRCAFGETARQVSQ
jgi:hypothetical protein